ncbi:hypothetical protein BDV18DRAFT_144925 [Aspergillus unguis]
MLQTPKTTPILMLLRLLQTTSGNLVSAYPNLLCSSLTTWEWPFLPRLPSRALVCLGWKAQPTSIYEAQQERFRPVHFWSPCPSLSLRIFIGEYGRISCQMPEDRVGAMWDVISRASYPHHQYAIESHHKRVEGRGPDLCAGLS